MGKQGGEADKSRLFIDGRDLEDGDFVPTKAFADDLQAAGKRSIAESPVALPREGRPDSRNEGFFWIDKLRLRLGQRRCKGANGFTGSVHGGLLCSGARSSPRPIWSAWRGCHARSPPWHPRG